MPPLENLPFDSRALARKPAPPEAQAEPAPRILVLDSDQATAEPLNRDLRRLGYQTLVAADADQARALLSRERPDLVFGDLLSLSRGGFSILSVLPEFERPPLIVLTGVETVVAAAAALRQGALFYLLRPFILENLKLAVEHALGQHRPGAPIYGPRQPQPASSEFIVGASPAIRALLELAEKVAVSEANIVIFGESGTGKELFAKVIHRCSGRSAEVFVPVDCAALPENLLEEELFGYEKGAFTGATQAKPGLMELARHGTLFFDEIAELPVRLQPKLLRALQERGHRRLGGARIVEFDVRIVAATNRNLRELVAQRQFRQDLFYRLNVVPLHLPPLRARNRDIVLLADHFLQENRRNHPAGPTGFAPEVLALFVELPWAGNVRELQNVVQYGCAVARSGLITLDDLPAELAGGDLATLKPGAAPRLSHSGRRRPASRSTI